jgi:type IV secretory pathway TrbD component
VRTHTIHQSLIRPILIKDGEREPMQATIGAIVLMFVLAWQFLSLPCLIVGLAACSLPSVLKRIAKHDPMMFQVYKRYLWTCLRSYYPARPHALAPPSRRFLLPVNFNPKV